MHWDFVLSGSYWITFGVPDKPASANEKSKCKSISFFLFLKKYLSKLHSFSEIKKSAPCADFSLDVGHTGFEPVTSTLST